MSESARKRQRVASLGSHRPEDREADTPHSELANIIPRPTTPSRRASSAGPTPVNRRTPNIFIRTPGTAARTPRAGPTTRPLSARKHAPTTPHAIRALRERANATRTPGHVRRRSGRVQRETPRDTLRALSKALADQAPARDEGAEAHEPTPRNPLLDLPDIDDGPDPVAPRLSMPLDDMYEDDSFVDGPPRQSLLPDLPEDVDTGTMHSLEFGRRALSEDPRSAFGGRVSERFAYLQDLGTAEEDFEIDGTFINRRAPLETDQLLQNAIEEALGDDTELQAGQHDGQPSETDLGVFGEIDEQDEPTFHFDIPRRIRAQELEEDLPESERDDAEVGIRREGDEGRTESLAIDNDVLEDIEPTGFVSDHGMQDDDDLQAYREEESAVDRSLLTQSPERSNKISSRTRRQRREVNISRFGNEYPSFPSSTLKRLASGLARAQGGNAKISPDTLAVLVQTTDWFFAQVGEDLAAYAQHAGRKMIEDADIIALMKRQRRVTNNTTAFSLAQKMLPRELVHELRMGVPTKLKGEKRKRLAAIAEGSEDG